MKRLLILSLFATSLLSAETVGTISFARVLQDYGSAYYECYWVWTDNKAAVAFEVSIDAGIYKYVDLVKATTDPDTAKGWCREVPRGGGIVNVSVRELIGSFTAAFSK